MGGPRQTLESRGLRMKREKDLAESEKYRYIDDDFWQLGLVAFQLLTGQPFTLSYKQVLELFLEPFESPKISPLVESGRQEWKTIINYSNMKLIKGKLVERLQ